LKLKHRIHAIHESEDYSGTGRDLITNSDKQGSHGHGKSLKSLEK